MAVLIAFHKWLSWVSIAPLGRPVVPDVYMRQDKSLPATLMPTAREHLFEICLAVRRLAADHHSGAHPDALASKRCAGGIGQVTRPHENVGAGIGQQIGHLGRGEPEVDGHEDRAELGGGEHRLQEGGAVDQQSGHPVALPHAELAQRPRELVGSPVELGVGNAAVPVDQRDTVS